MNFRKIFTALAAFVIAFTGALALDLPVKNINGKTYYYYTVKKNEALYEMPLRMGVPRNVIIKYNPNAAEGIQEGMILTIPIQYDAKIKDGYYVIPYTPSSRETIYGVATKFNVTVDRIIEFNPKASEGVRGLTLEIPVAKAPASKQKPKEPVKPKEKVSDSTSGTSVPADTARMIPNEQPAATVPSPADGEASYIIQEGESIESIAANHGISAFDILKANPSMSISEFVPGARINLPASRSLIDSEKRFNQFVEIGDSEEELTVADEPKALSIALMLPFSLDSVPDKQAQLYTEFYRGFLMGVEKLSHSGGEHLVVEAIDSSIGTDSLIARMPNRYDIIVTSDNTKQIDDIAVAANEMSPESIIFNLFAVKYTVPEGCKNVIQANIPRDEMYRKAIDGFVDKYKGFTPVFIARIDGSAEKSDFTSQLKSRLDRDSIKYIEINFRSFLGKDNLEGLNTTDSSFVFVPVTGSRSEFAKFAPAIKNLRSSSVNPLNVAVFGYPEWVVFRNDYLDQLHWLNTTIYSRFFIAPEDVTEQQFRAQYRQWYGTDVIDAVPSQAMLGYDAAMYLIKRLRGELDGGSYEGIQSGFNFVETDAGTHNECLYFINFRPTGVVTKNLLR